MRTDRFVDSEYRRGKDHIAEFANVTAPAVIFQCALRFLGKIQVRISTMEKEVGQRNDVFLAFAKRRNVEMNLIQAMKEIIAEDAARSLLFEITTRRSNYADVDRYFFLPTHSVIGCAVEDAQQLYLCAWLEFSDFIQKQGAGICQLEETRLLPVGAAECALLVSEKLAFDEMLRKSPAVHVDPGFVAAQGVMVNRSGDDLLARPGLACNQYRRARLSDAFGHRQKAL